MVLIDKSVPDLYSNLGEATNVREVDMSEGRVARVTEVIAGSPTGFDDAVKVAFERANQTLRNITGMKVVEQRVMCEAGQIQEFRVKLEVIFVLE
jgi:dodecin